MRYQYIITSIYVLDQLYPVLLLWLVGAKDLLATQLFVFGFLGLGFIIVSTAREGSFGASI
eukprot:COSAG05_NODE_2082_length_3598_cov_9.622464_3_plen_60_part_01